MKTYPDDSSEDAAVPIQEWYPIPVPLPSGLAPSALRNQVRQQMLVLQETEKAVAKKRGELNMIWNSTIPINRLPNELFISIFTSVVEDSWAMPDWNQLTCPVASTKWIKLIFICRHWRDAIYTSPCLWRVIDTRLPSYSQRALMLSFPATIDILFRRQSGKHAQDGLEMLRTHTGRIRSFNCGAVREALRPAVISLLQDAMPALETLTLTVLWRKTHEATKDDFVDVQLTQERFPRLRSLATAFTIAPQDIQVYTHLHKLSLVDCHCPFSFDHFLDALAASTNLEVMELISVLQRMEGNWVDGTVTRKHPLSLNHLKSLTLKAHSPAHTSRFLSHVLLSPTVSIYISCGFGDVSEHNITETIATSLPPNPAIVMPALRMATEVSVCSFGLDYSITCDVQPNERGIPLITFDIRSSIFFEWLSDSIHLGIRDLLSIFTSPSWIVLNVSGPDGDRVDEETWATVFTTYPLLQTLNFRNDGASETAFAGLMDATPPPDSSVPCPGLKSLLISGHFYEEAIDVMLQCLRDRADKGHRLETAAIHLDGDRQDHGLMETQYLPELRELVADVSQYRFVMSS